MADNILDGLNKEQLEAVTTTEGYVRVIAGAGSGKTNALTKRYAYLVDRMDISPERILSVTFTNKAANEMRERIIRLVGDIGTPYIMTFHGFCNRFLHSEIESLGFSQNYKIMDTDDQLDVLKVVYNELGINNTDIPYKKALNEIIGAGCKNGHRVILDNYEEILEQYTSHEIHQLMQMTDDINLKIIYGYLREQKRDGCLDYEDLLNLTLYILKTRRDIRESWEQVFDYVQVDEFQDVSLREVELVAIFSEKNRNLFVVGDDFQSIYSFRGSDANCIVQFGEIMDKLQGRHNEVKTIMMTQNYRSTPQILNVSNALIKANKNQVQKDLFTQKDSGVKVLHYHARNVYQEASWVANRILSLHRQFDDFAVLYRSNFSSRAIEEKLIENSIPYEVLSGVSFYARKEVKDVLAMLGLVAFGDNLSFNRIIKNLSLGIGAKKIAVLKELAGQNESLYNVLRKSIDTKTFKNTKAKWLVDFVEELKVYAVTETIAMLMGRIYSELKLEETYIKSGEQERWENLQELKKSAQHYEHNIREKADLGEYLSMLSLYTNEDREEKPHTVKLMTVHGAKGLEFPIVFVIGMNEGVMPNAKISGAAEMEEERRIAYVAMTRAKEMLFLSDAEGENFDKSYRIPSRFLLDIPRDLYNSEGKIDEFLLKQTQAKMQQDSLRFGNTDFSILGTIEDRSTIKVHDRVKHDIYGEGVVMNIINDAYVIVFDNAGLKGIRKDSKKLMKIS